MEDAIINAVSNDTVTDFVSGSLLGLLVWFFGGLDGLLLVLITFSVIDYISGVYAACVRHELSSAVGFNGIARKMMMFMFVGMAHLIDQYLPNNTGSLRAIVCLFYIINESVSIFENAEKVGVTIPKPLHNFLAKLHNQANKSEKQLELVHENKQEQQPELPETKETPDTQELPEQTEEFISEKGNKKKNDRKKSA